MLAHGSSQTLHTTLRAHEDTRVDLWPKMFSLLFTDRHSLVRSRVLPLTCKSLQIHMSMVTKGKLGHKENTFILQVRSVPAK